MGTSVRIPKLFFDLQDPDWDLLFHSKLKNIFKYIKNSVSIRIRIKMATLDLDPDPH